MPMLDGFTNVCMTSDVDSRNFTIKSTLGYLITLAGRIVLWQSKLHKCVALSTTEVEYIVTTKACKEI